MPAHRPARTSRARSPIRYLGNVNQVGPYGSTTYSQGGTYGMTGPDGQTYQVPRFTQTTTLSPEQQKLYDQQTQLGTSLNNLALSQTQRLADHLGKPIDFSGLPDISNDFSAERNRVEQAMSDRLAPQNDRELEAERSRLTNRASSRVRRLANAMDDYNRGSMIRSLAITGQGLNEMQGLYGIASNRRSQAMQEMLQARNQPINEIAALMGGGQVHLPGAQAYQGGNIAAADVAGNVYNTAALQQKQYEQQMAQHNQNLAGMYGLGQAAIGGGARLGEG